MSIFDSIAGKIGQVEQSPANIPDSVGSRLPLARKLLSGDFEGAIKEALGIDSDEPFRGPFLIGPSPLLGGITLKRAKEIFYQHAGLDLAKKNLFAIRVTDFRQKATGIDFNMIALDVNYSPITVSGDAVRVGSGSFDTLQNSERVEIRVTTLDDSHGTLKKWFRDRHDAMCKADGTVGLPVEYLLRIEIMHAFIGPDAVGANNAFIDTYIVRPTSIEYDLSRRDDAMTEIQLGFTQFDTFTNLR